MDKWDDEDLQDPPPYWVPTSATAEYRAYGAFLKHVHQGNPVKAIAKWDYLLKRDGEKLAVTRLKYVLDNGPALLLSDYQMIYNITGVEV